MKIGSKIETLLIGLGAQKAGTSWLSDYLASHPDVYISPAKELHVFDVRKSAPQLRRRQSAYLHRSLRGIENIQKSLKSETEVDPETIKEAVDQIRFSLDKFAMLYSDDNYLDFFESRLKNEKIACDFTPAYSVLNREDYARIYGLHEAVKFIFILRNPVDRLWSAVKYFVQRNAPDEHPIERIGTALESPATEGRSNYKRTISELEAVVPRDRILFLFYEDLFNQDTVNRVCDFLKITREPGQFKQRVNETTVKASLPEDMRGDIVKSLSSNYHFAHERFGASLPESWKRDMENYL